MKRLIYWRAEVSGHVELPIDDEEQWTADPDGKMTDGEAGRGVC